jgi:probable HAF family extracellular repeat protein
VVGTRSSATGTDTFTWKDGVMTILGIAFGPVAINRSGEIAGNRTFVGGTQAVIWRNGELTPLGTLGGPWSIATDMNDKGQVVGYSRLAGGTADRAFIWENGTMTDLGTLGGSSAVATGINKHGQVVGYSQTAGNTTTHAFLWERGVMTDLGTLGGDWSSAAAINDLGVVVGLSRAPGILQPPGGRPFMWQKGVMTAIPMPAASSVVAAFQIHDISNAGHIVGARMYAALSTYFRAFVWRDGVFVELPVVYSGDHYALSVNSSGEIVGYSIASVASPGAYLWTVRRQGP